MHSRGRLDALGDGIFGVAMTLLVLDLRLPEDFHPQTSSELVHGLAELSPKFFPYALSFYVLGLRWQWEAEERVNSERRLYGRGYVQLWLLLLFLVTCTPFTTIVLGRFTNIPAAIWLYVANIASLSLVSFLLAGDTHELGEQRRRERLVGLAALMVSSVVAIGVSFVVPQLAIWALALNFFIPLVMRFWPLRHSTPER
jgi:uncharacterized membrane protein